MPHYFFDTSALVKHYHTDPVHSESIKFWAKPGPTIPSRD